MTSRAVLIVDDDPSIREVATMSLELVGGWRVVTARDGAEGLERIARHRPDVVLLDVMMPVLDGIATCTRIREKPETADLPVILVTAKIAPGDRQEWDGLAVSGVIAKPFDPMTLPAQVSAMLGWD
ncbi:MAG TPA: response regulator [Ornithinimicrobium sp.]|uniref:response regulator n=1 Tax=Ornithinimicrobium sp. TaxID=1977084 RepID=UPI002B4685BB|nr:response regulator [Ornithinimicrobium sp.]HKJ13024.1 response regulator [Ornithinimicrobium sp.]